MTEKALSEQPSPARPPITASESRHTRWFLVAFYALGIVWGVRNVRFSEPSGLDLWVPVALAISLGWWALADARRRRYSVPMLARPWFFLLAIVVVPGYVVWSREWRGLGWVVLHAALWYGLAAVVMNAGGVIVFGNKWLRAAGV